MLKKEEKEAETGKVMLTKGAPSGGRQSDPKKGEWGHPTGVIQDFRRGKEREERGHPVKDEGGKK